VGSSRGGAREFTGLSKSEDGWKPIWHAQQRSYDASSSVKTVSRRRPSTLAGKKSPEEEVSCNSEALADSAKTPPTTPKNMTAHGYNVDKPWRPTIWAIRMLRGGGRAKNRSGTHGKRSYVQDARGGVQRPGQKKKRFVVRKRIS